MHLMIDLETLALSPNAVVTQIGWAVFNIDSENLIGTGLIHLEPGGQIRRGRSVDWETIGWWLRQDEPARQAMTEPDRFDTADGLGLFVTKIQNEYGWENIGEVWSNGPSFDQTIMEDLFFHYDIKTPWKYNAGRDVRTMAMLTPGVPKVKPTVAHNAMSDAIAQATYVQNSYRALQVSK